jgi:integrase/recombinase XerD
MEEKGHISPARAPRKERRARTLTAEQIDRVIAHIHATSNSPFSDEVKLLLSFYAGLRASEIASLTIADVCDAEGRIGRSIIIRACNAKTKRSRSIPIHQRLREALVRLRTAHPEVPFIAFSNLGPIKHQKVGAVTAWFHLLYRTVGLEGCSSHSGRRSFITNLARSANQFNNSLRDVQILAGHVRLDTTERYIDRAADLTALVGSLGQPMEVQS